MKQLTVMTIEGQKSLINVDDDTTNRSLLQTVAHAINSPADAVRLLTSRHAVQCNGCRYMWFTTVQQTQPQQAVHPKAAQNMPSVLQLTNFDLHW